MAQHRAPRKHVGTWIVITVLLAAAVIGTLWVPFYNHLTPTLGDFPFFYWYQLMWVPIVAVLSWLAYLLIGGSRPDAPGTATTAGTAHTDQGSGEEEK